MLFKEIRLQTNHVSALYYFYKEVLELATVYSNEKSFTVTVGETNLIFEETHDIENPLYHFAFNIPVNKFDEAFQWLKNKVELLWLDDYKSLIADFINWHAKSIYFNDPGGNILELITRFDLNDNVNEKFSSKHLRNVSEIGLVYATQNFDEKVEELLAQYPLSYFHKQPPLPHFRAVGNDEGLFVIVPENRVWFSTKNTISQIFPLKINFHVDDKPYQLII
ncbi:MAG: hypothetical protein ABI472_19510 [Ginsengibacter sp.]